MPTSRVDDDLDRDLATYRYRVERLVERIARTRLPTRVGDFTAFGYGDAIDDAEHMALVCGDLSGDEPVLTRIRSECLTGDVFGSRRCDCGPQLEEALERVVDEGRGVVVYLRGHEGRGVGLADKLRAYELQDAGLVHRGRQPGSGAARERPPVRGGRAGAARPERRVGASAHEQPGKTAALEKFGVRVEERDALTISPTATTSPTSPPSATGWATTCRA